MKKLIFLFLFFAQNYSATSCSDISLVDSYSESEKSSSSSTTQRIPLGFACLSMDEFSQDKEVEDDQSEKIESVDWETIDDKPTKSVQVETQPVETLSTEREPVEAIQIDTKPVEIASMDETTKLSTSIILPDSSCEIKTQMKKSNPSHPTRHHSSHHHSVHSHYTHQLKDYSHHTQQHQTLLRPSHHFPSEPSHTISSKTEHSHLLFSRAMKTSTLQHVPRKPIEIRPLQPKDDHFNPHSRREHQSLSTPIKPQGFMIYRSKQRKLRKNAMRYLKKLEKINELELQITGKIRVPITDEVKKRFYAITGTTLSRTAISTSDITQSQHHAPQHPYHLHSSIPMEHHDYHHPKSMEYPPHGKQYHARHPQTMHDPRLQHASLPQEMHDPRLQHAKLPYQKDHIDIEDYQPVQYPQSELYLERPDYHHPKSMGYPPHGKQYHARHPQTMHDPRLQHASPPHGKQYHARHPQTMHDPRLQHASLPQEMHDPRLQHAKLPYQKDHIDIEDYQPVQYPQSELYLKHHDYHHPKSMEYPPHGKQYHARHPQTMHDPRLQHASLPQEMHDPRLQHAKLPYQKDHIDIEDYQPVQYPQSELYLKHHDYHHPKSMGYPPHGKQYHARHPQTMHDPRLQHASLPQEMHDPRLQHAKLPYQKDHIDIEDYQPVQYPQSELYLEHHDYHHSKSMGYPPHGKQHHQRQYIPMEQTKPKQLIPSYPTKTELAHIPQQIRGTTEQLSPMFLVTDPHIKAKANSATSTQVSDSFKTSDFRLELQSPDSVAKIPRTSEASVIK